MVSLEQASLFGHPKCLSYSCHNSGRAIARLNLHSIGNNYLYPDLKKFSKEQK